MMRKILLTRDSVSMGDDTIDHKLEIEINENWKLPEILDEIKKIQYLPLIYGGMATWSISYHSPLAVLAQQWDKPKIFFMETEFPFQGTSKFKDFHRLHFIYHVQKDPDLVFNILNELRRSFYLFP